MADKYIKPSGQGGDYTTLAAWEAQNLDLVTATAIENAIIDGDWTGITDSTATSINGWTTNASYYINIYTTAAARHSGKWDSTKYRLSITGQYDTAIDNYADYVYITGLQISGSHALWARYGINSASTGASTKFGIDKCIIVNFGGTGAYGIQVADAAGYIRNTIIYGSTNSFYYGIYFSSVNAGTWVLNNVTVYNCSNKGIYPRYGSGHSIENCVSMAGTQDFNYDFGGTGSINNNVSSDATADDAGGIGHLINKTASNQFVSLTGGSEDFHVKDTAADIYNTGKDLSGVFTDDIDGGTRSGTWDIGADEYVAAGGLSIPVAKHVRSLSPNFHVY